MELYLSKDKKYFLIEGITDILQMEALREYLSYTVPYLYALQRKYPQKFNGWDGKTEYIDKFMRIPKGLWSEVYSFCKTNDIPLKIYGLKHIMDNSFNFDEFSEFALDLFDGHPTYTPYDYQIEAAGKILKYKYNQSEIATSAGKTLISYMIFMWLKLKKNYKQQLIIVPRINLITQLLDDFAEYNHNNIPLIAAQIGGGTNQDNVDDADYIVGTYQSLNKKNKEWFKYTDSLFVDEAHYTHAKSIKKVIKIIDEQLNIKYGMSGTIKDDRGSILDSQSFLGPIIQKISPAFLMDGGFASNVHITVKKLNYLSTERREALQHVRIINAAESAIKALALEKDVIRDSTVRFKYIVNDILTAQQNSLVLFSDIKNGYGKRIYQYLKEVSDKRVYYIDGSVKSDIRDYFKKVMEDEDAILVASTQTLSTGISINNISNVFLVESYKSRTVVLQSIGRGMRLHEKKQHVNIVDYIDDFRVKDGKRKENYVWNHGKERIHYYKHSYETAEDSKLTIINVNVGETFKEIISKKLF